MVILQKKFHRLCLRGLIKVLKGDVMGSEIRTAYSTRNPHKNISRACHFARLLFTHNIQIFRFASVSAPRSLKNWNKKLPFADAPDSEN